MAAEFVFSPPAGGGGTPSPGGQKKKGMNKLYLYIGGALVIMLYIIFIKRTSTQTAPTTDQTTTGYPSNGVDVAAQLQNNADILQGNMDATLNQFQAQLNSDYGTQLNQIAAKMDAFQGKLDELNSHPAPTQTPTPTPTPTPAPTPAPAPSGPSWKGALQGGYSYATPRGGWNSGTSVVDYLKSHGYNADMNARTALANAMGIGGYSGSASQNVQMLNNLRNAGV